MADLLLAATIQVLLEKAVSVAADRIGLVLGFGFHKELEAFKELAQDIQAVLVDAEKKQTQSQFVRRWLHKVEAAAVEADNVLDELLYESLRRKVETMNKAKRAAKVCLFFSLSKHDLSFRWRMGSKVREINEMFKNFILEAPKIGLMSMVNTMVTSNVGTNRETNSLPEFVVGRDEEVSEIVDMLLSSSSESSASVSVLSIVGMGGLGKTTLAKSIYNNSGIDSHFGRKIWVCVSNNFEPTELFRLILESLEGENIARFGQDSIVQKIREKLDGKKFLLILDDVWNEDQKLWDSFFSSLAGLNTASGSCCLVTTRLEKTAKLVSTFIPFVLDKLSDDKCWHILCRRATNDMEMPPQVEVHKEEILKRCQGLPLAANAVGGLLSLQKREDWLSIVEEDILMLSEYIEGEINPVLRLSFDYLPSSSIKKCFAYCSIFSKDTEMNCRKLVELWIAEGFLQEGVERRITMEEVGDDHLKVLLQSSLLKKVQWWLGEDTYQMHDLVHDLAESVSKREQINSEVRHLALALRDIDYELLRLNARDVIKYNARSPLVQIVNGEISDEVLLRFPRLRVLNLCGLETEYLSNALGKVKHLRHLDVSFSKIKMLPDALCKLYNLHTLKLNKCLSLQSLPHGLSHLISLRHLHFAPRDMKFKMPPNMGQITCLQTLNHFSVGAEKGHGIEELGSMKNLAGRICLSNLELVKGKEGARLANLFEKKKLEALNLYWGFIARDGSDNGNDEHVLEGLEPHFKLQKLTLENYMGARLPQWFGQLKALTELRFIKCKSLTDLPTLGHLPYLKDLEIEGLEHVVSIGASFYLEGLREGKVFPSLESLKLKTLPNLTEWKELEEVNGQRSEVFPKLKSLLISDCCQLASVPSPFPSLEELEIMGNIQFSVVRDIIGKSSNLLKTLEITSMGGLNRLADVIENHLTCLTWFIISNCGNLVDLSSSTLEGCTSLTTLYMSDCPNMMPCALNFQRTPSLSVIVLRDCPNMFTTNVMPTGFDSLTSLTSLSIGPFTDETIQIFNWSGLIQACSSTLQSLTWVGSPQNHTCPGLPQQLKHLTSLRTLMLYGLNSLEALPEWLEKFTSLRKLTLWDCPKLQHISSMASLTNLQKLDIYTCPLIPESSIQDISSTFPNLKISRRLFNQILVLRISLLYRSRIFFDTLSI